MDSDLEVLLGGGAVEQAVVVEELVPLAGHLGGVDGGDDGRRADDAALGVLAGVVLHLRKLGTHDAPFGSRVLLIISYEKYANLQAKTENPCGFSA